MVIRVSKCLSVVHSQMKAKYSLSIPSFFLQQENHEFIITLRIFVMLASAAHILKLNDTEKISMAPGQE